MIQKIIIAAAIVIGALAAVASANVAERHVALEFSDHRVSLLRGDFKTAKQCQAFIAERRKLPPHSD